MKIVSRSPHKPTPETSAQVEALSGYGIKHEEIALYLSIDAKKLRKHYRNVLDTGTVKANVQVARALHKQAMGGNTAAMIFWMKARGGWRENINVNHGGQPGNPIEMLIAEVSGHTFPTPEDPDDGE